MGELTFTRLLERFGSTRSVLREVRRGALAGDGSRGLAANSDRRLPARVVEAMAQAAQNPRRIHDRLEELRLWTLTPLDDEYPARLRILDPPPPVVYGWGTSALLAVERSVAVVGTRRPTPAGRALAARIGVRLAQADVVVVSGLALGIDGAAQAATVEHDGRTVGVLGSGHARPGPRAHRALIERIVARGGAVISELPPDSVPTRGTFPRRNRVISALAEAVVVVEAPAGSGALITARHALEQGRELFAAPGRIGDPTTAGCLALLRETPARVIVGMDELILDLGYAGAPASRVGGIAPRLTRSTALELLAPVERAVAGAICEAPGGLDTITARSGLAPGVVAGALTLLQLRGWVQIAGSAYLPAGPLLVD